MSTSGRAAMGISRLLKKLEESLAAEKFYEAHQLYRTLYFRYLAQKRYDELIEFLYEGAKKLLLRNQQASGTDLAILMVEVMTQAKTPPEMLHFQRISGLLSLIGSDVIERDAFLSKAIHWSIKDTEQHKKGHPQLHQAVAQVFWREKNYYHARFHFLHSPDGQGCASMLIELHMARGFASEVDLFIAQAVLQYLCLHNKNAAALALSSYTAQHPNIKKKNPPYLLPLLNFLWFLLQAIESGKLALFTMLCDKYQPSLGRDPSYREYLEKIAQIFFDVMPPKTTRPRGLFDNLLQTLLVSRDEDEEEGGHEAAGSSSAASSTRQVQRLQQQPMETDDLD